MSDDGTNDEPEAIRPFFYAVDEIPAESIADQVEQYQIDDEMASKMFDLYGRTLLTKTILRSPTLNVFHESVGPGESVKPHRHGTHQLTYVIRGELKYGNRTTSAGMGYFSPNKPYAWTAGDEGAEWIEIHAGEPQAFVD